MEALISGLLVGVFTIIGIFLTNRHYASEAIKRMDHDREMAQEAFQKEKTASENDKLAAQIDSQLTWGERIALAVGRAAISYKDGSSHDERKETLERVMALAGMTLEDYSPLASLLEPELLEDYELRELIIRHRTMAEDALVRLIVSDQEPAKVQDDPDAIRDGLRTGKAAIALRIRDIRRRGAPL